MAKPTLRVRPNPRPMTEAELAEAHTPATREATRRRPAMTAEEAEAIRRGLERAADERYRRFLEAVQIAALELQPPPTAKA